MPFATLLAALQASSRLLTEPGYVDFVFAQAAAMSWSMAAHKQAYSTTGAARSSQAPQDLWEQHAAAKVIRRQNTTKIKVIPTTTESGCAPAAAGVGE